MTEKVKHFNQELRSTETNYLDTTEVKFTVQFGKVQSQEEIKNLKNKKMYKYGCKLPEYVNYHKYTDLRSL